MDVIKALRELHEEKRRLDRVIGALEATLEAQAGNRLTQKTRRGRKSMSAEERIEVSRRMSEYWAAKRAQRNGAEVEEVRESVPVKELARQAIA